MPPRTPLLLHPGRQDGKSSLRIWKANKAHMLALLAGPQQDLFDRFGALVKRPTEARLRAEVGAALEYVISEVNRGDNTQLADLGVRLGETLKNAKLTPTRKMARSKMTRGGGVGQTEKMRLSLELAVLRLMLRNMPGGLNGAHPSLSAQMARAARRRRRIRAACIPRRRCAES